MRISDQDIHYLAQKVIRRLVSSGEIDVDAEEPVVQGLATALLHEVRLEDALSEEARQILLEHSGAMARDSIMSLDMFRKVKRELAKKKGVIL
jgi:hypothetical protein